MDDLKSVPEDMVYRSTKTYDHNTGLSCAFRQWRADSHCKYLHGYALKIHLVFASPVLDVRNWVVDFGSLKPLKGILENALDHKTLVAEDDPHIGWFREGERLGTLQLEVVPSTGCEATARLIYEVTAQWLCDAGYSHVTLERVEVHEHSGNSASFGFL